MAELQPMVVYQNRTFYNIAASHRQANTKVQSDPYNNRNIKAQLLTVRHIKTPHPNAYSIHYQHATSTNSTNPNHANRNFSTATLPHPAEWTRLYDRRLLRDMVPTLQANRTHLQPTVHCACLAREVRLCQSQRGRAEGDCRTIRCHSYANLYGFQGWEKN